nr:prepilin-type N-terminal cleavage/methylation domain-containing protein [Cytobacillus firmus]
MNSKGFTLIELLAVIAVLGILAAIAVLSIGDIIEKSRRDDCDVNTVEVKRQYKRQLHLDGTEHYDVVFVCSVFNGFWGECLFLGRGYSLC